VEGQWRIWEEVDIEGGILDSVIRSRHLGQRHSLLQLGTSKASAVLVLCSAVSPLVTWEIARVHCSILVPLPW
jgi:hypothetical protein